MKRLFWIFCLLSIFSCGIAQVRFPSFALVDVTIVDANHPQPLAHQTVLVTGKTIHAIFPDGTGKFEDSVMVFNMHGRYLIPGLIDTHVHLATDPSETDNRASTLNTLHKMLFSGITSVRDMAGDARVLSGLARDALNREIISPDIYYSALMAGPKFFTDPRTIATARGGVAGQMPYMKAVTDSTDLVRAVAEAKGTGASGIKLYANLSPQLVERIVQEANRQHMKVWAHAWLSPAKPASLVRAGVGSISHSNLLVYEKLDSIPVAWKKTIRSTIFYNDSLPDLSALFSLMKEHHTILDATLSAFKADADESPTATFFYQLTRTLTMRAYKAGVTICAGTDDDQRGFVQHEMDLLVHDAGFTPLDALIAATKHGAEAIGILDRCGTVEINKNADLLLLDKNPLENISNVGSVYLVVKCGEIYKN